MKSPAHISLLLAFSLFFIVGNSQEQCYDFNGTGAAFHLPFQDLSGNTELTIEAWVNAENLSNSYHTIYRQNAIDLPALFTIGFKDNGALLYFGINTSTGYQEASFSVNPTDYLNTWRHISGTYNAGVMTLYVDAVPVSVLLHSGTLEMGVISTHRIGTSVRSEYFEGKIDEVRLWSIALTDGEIDSLKDCSINSPKDGLVVSYNFNHLDGSVLVESTGTGYNGNLAGVSNDWQESDVAFDCVLPDHVDEISVQDFTLFPNPVVNTATIHFKSHSINRLEVFDLMGKSVRSIQFNASKSIELNMSDMENGIYFIRFYSVNGDVGVSRIIKG